MEKKEFEIESKKAQFFVQNAMEDITKETRKVLKEYVKRNYLISFAKVMAYLGIESEDSNELLEIMEPDIRNKILNLSESMKKQDSEVLKEIEHIVENSKLDLDADYSIITENLLQSGKVFAENAIHNFKIETPIFSNRLDSCIFEFEDIKYMDNRSMQKILREIDQLELTIALKGVEKEIQDKFFNNMSTRAATMLKEDMEFMGPVPLSQVEENQISIIHKIFQLAEMGEIIILSQMNVGDLVN